MRELHTHYDLLSNSRCTLNPTISPRYPHDAPLIPRYLHGAPLTLYQQHTKNCTACQGALKRVRQLLTAAKASAVASLSWVSQGYAAYSVLSSLSNLPFTSPPPYLIYLTEQPKSHHPSPATGGFEGGTCVQYVHLRSSSEHYYGSSNASRPRDDLRKPSCHQGDVITVVAKIGFRL